MIDGRRLVALSLLATLAGGCAARGRSPRAAAPGPCVPPATWVDPATRRPLAPAAVLDAARRRRVVLLGERHDVAEDHRWQAATLAMLWTVAPRLVVGFEMLTPAADPALARWVRGDGDFDAFVRDVAWDRAWGLPASLYGPVFRMGRLLGLELRGINIDHALVRRIGRGGRAALAARERAGLAPARPASPAYRARIAEAFATHRCRPARDGDPAFERFVEAQRTWDAAMAASLARLLAAAPGAIVVGLVGRGHVERRDGLAADLAALGHPPLVLLPWDVDAPCDTLPPDLADAVFGLVPPPGETPSPPPAPCARDAQRAR